jgi:glutathione synthase/RimK-type ligase-like ATP-grasp enzyme
MIQPYLSSLEREGETSLVFVAGELLHGLRKRPERGDFRVQPQYGGTHEAIDPDPGAIEIARAAIAAAPAEPLYARVDLVRDDEGGLRLIELELIEPNLYIDVAPAGAERIARALLSAAA